MTTKFKPPDKCTFNTTTLFQELFCEILMLKVETLLYGNSSPLNFDSPILIGLTHDGIVLFAERQCLPITSVVKFVLKTSRLIKQN